MGELSVKASTQLGWQGCGVPQECLVGYGATNTPRPLISLGMPMDMSASSTSTHPCAHSPATVATTQMPQEAAPPLAPLGSQGATVKSWDPVSGQEVDVELSLDILGMLGVNTSPQDVVELSPGKLV